MRTPIQRTIQLNMPKQPDINITSLVAAGLWLLSCAVVAGCVTVGLLMAAGVIK
jgi:hypothetical protein